ncbi:hypothetical protein ERJ75_000636400 [Trypanosoma vivax]|nr:hypothetical protein ERJ75_000636400 [Trypanosoma vivax]
MRPKRRFEDRSKGGSGQRKPVTLACSGSRGAGFGTHAVELRQRGQREWRDRRGAKAKAHIEATLKQQQSKATEARGEAEKTLNAAVTLARKARVQAGKIDGMVDMLATWNSGRQTESNGAAMCLADTVAACKNGLAGTAPQANATQRQGY